MKRIMCSCIMFNMILIKLFSQVFNNDKNTEETNGGTANRIAAVSVSGLKRTKPHVLENPLQKFIGMDEQDADINEVYAVIEDTGILEPQSIEIVNNQDGEGKILKIRVREKWSILFGPYFNISSNNWSAGGAVYDTNSFGLKDTMLVMGMYGKNEWAAHAAYTNTPDAIGRFGFIIDGLFSSKDNENKNQTGDAVLRRFNTFTVNPSFSLMYSLTDLLTPSLGVSYRYSMLQSIENPLNAPEDGIQAITITPGIGIRHSSWDGYLLSEKSMVIKYNYGIVFEDSAVHSVSLDAKFKHSIVPGFRLVSKAALLFSSPSAAPYFETSPVSAINILPSTYSAANYAGISLGLEKYLFKFPWGTFALSLAYQVVYSDGELLRSQFDHGPAVFLQMYFRRLAVPGIALGTAYNVDKNYFEFVFNIGIGF